MLNDCQHNLVTSTFKTGPICCDCNTPLISMFHAIPRDLIERALEASAPSNTEGVDK